MWAKRILLNFSLLCFVARGRSQSDVKLPAPKPANAYGDEEVSIPSNDIKCTHIMYVPTVLKSGNTGQVCVFLKCEETLKLETALEYNGTKTVILDEEVTSQYLEYFKCKTFPVPTVDKPEPVFVILSAIGKTTEKRERKSVAIDNMPEACFAQMEKPLYRPGDRVRCRMICLNSDLKATKQNFTKVYLTEPSGARISQILNPESDHDVSTVEFNIDGEATPGQYYFTFERESGVPVSQWFSVERYMLPRYDSKISCPSSVSVLEKTGKLDVSAQYVYGKPVPATVLIRCCRQPGYSYGRSKNCFKGLEDICLNFTGKLDSNGSYSKNMNLDVFQLQLSGLANSINCDLTVKEDGTGVLVKKSCYIGITSQPINLQLDYSFFSQYYKHGLDFQFAAILTDEKGLPLPSEIIIIEVDGKYVKKVTTDTEGRAECGIDTTPYFKPNITIRASYQEPDQCYTRDFSGLDFPHAELVVYRFFSESDSYLQIKKPRGQLSGYQNHSIGVDYIITEAGAGKGATNTTLYYLIKAREAIVGHGQKVVDLTNKGKGSFSIDIYASPDYFTTADLLVIGVMDSELISDIVTLDIESGFNNSVSMKFNETVVAPGSNVEQQLEAAPGSFCGLRAIDASFSILRSYESFSPESIYNSLRYYHYAYQVKEFDFEEPKPPCEDPNNEVFCNGRYYRPVSSYSDGDTYDNLKSSSLTVATNLRVRKPVVCGMEKEQIFPRLFSKNIAFATAHSGGGGAPSTIETIRTNLAETFGWHTVIINKHGQGAVTSKIPDTITEWNSNMFCTSQEAGFGMTNQSAKVTTFLTFFIETTVPHYCTRGEKIIIDTSAANYLNKCIKVQLTVRNSDDFEVSPLGVEVDTCICHGERVSRQWSLDFKSLGKINITASAATTHISDTCDGPNDSSQLFRRDTVILNIDVEAEGIKQDFTSSHLLRVNGSNINTEINIPVPDNLVPDSFQLSLTVVGDTVGLSVENLGNLLLLPGGCCEQSLAQLLPIVYMMKYFQNKGELTDEFYERSKTKLTQGYGRQIACRSYDGSYSVFRNSYYRNTWLDINTYFTFEQIKPYTFVDENVQIQTLLLLAKQQNLKTGCLSAIGSLFTEQDKTDDTFRYTAYTATRLLKTELYSIGETLLNGTRQCLRAVDFKNQSIYTQAYMFYFAALDKQWDTWDSMFTTINEKAKYADGTIHWERENLHRPVQYYFYVYSSAEVEITATIMLAIMNGPNMTPELMDFVSQIAVWLTSQRNSRGGFSSSQDTIVATEAITYYGQLVHVKEPQVEVAASQGNGEIARISVNKENKFLVQRQHLTTSFGLYKFSISGTGNPLVQLTAKFNRKVTKEDAPFSLVVKTRAEVCFEGVAAAIDVEICTSYKGSRNQTNMALIDFKCLTGYTPDYFSVNQLLGTTPVSEFTMTDNHVHFYLKSVPHTEICFKFTLFMSQRVLIMQASSAIIYDYYEDESGFAEYSHPCSPQPEE